MHLPAVLPPAEAEWEEGRQEEAAAADGRDAAADHRPGPHAPAGLADPGEDVRSASDAWQQLLSELRGDPRAPGGAAAPDAQPVVEAQPSDRVLLAQSHGKAAEEVGRLKSPSYTHLWIVNTFDWIDVEHVLRRMLRCESSDCHHFHSTGYVYFRSCAIMHVACPGEFLRAGVLYRFPDTEVVVEILEAHPEGVLEVGCYLEYVPM